MERLSEQAGLYQHAPEDALTRMWELFLQGTPATRIAEMLGIERHTVTRHLRALSREARAERNRSNAHKLDVAIARMRRVQAQAWADHDRDEGGGRSGFLRVILEVEREIARLEGLYEGPSRAGNVTFTLVRSVGEERGESGGEEGRQ